MKKILLTLSIYIIFFTWPVFAQDDSGPVRVEFDASAEVFELIPCGELGVLMFYESVKQTDNLNKAWVFIFYDKNLNAQWSKEIPVLEELNYRGFRIAGEDVYIAFQNNDKSRAEVHNFQLLHINIIDATFNHTGVFIPEKAQLVSFEVLGNTLVLGLNYWKERALVLIKDLNTDKQTTISFTEEPTFIEDILLSLEERQLYVTLNIYTSKKRSSLYLNSYNPDGELQKSVIIAPLQESQKLMNAQLNLEDDGSIYILGTYNSMNGKLSRTEEGKQGEESEGFYIAKTEGGEQKFIKLYNLLDFKNITEILNNQELKDIKNIINKNEKKNKDQSVYYEFLIHEMYSAGDDFILLAEAYYPEYHQVSTMSYDFYGRPMPYYYNIFDGFRYFNAFVVSFDYDGNLNWSNGIKIWDMLSQKLLKKVEIFRDSNHLVLFYNHEGNIVSKVVNGYDEVGDVEKNKIATTHPDDVQIEAGSGMIRHWYDGYFIAYGYQTLRNSTLGGGSKRRVFYFSKLAFD